MPFVLEHSQKGTQWSLFVYQERSVVDINAVLPALHILGSLLDLANHEVNGDADGVFELPGLTKLVISVWWLLITLYLGICAQRGEKSHLLSSQSKQTHDLSLIYPGVDQLS